MKPLKWMTRLSFLRGKAAEGMFDGGMTEAAADGDGQPLRLHFGRLSRRSRESRRTNADAINSRLTSLFDSACVHRMRVDGCIERLGHAMHLGGEEINSARCAS